MKARRSGILVVEDQLLLAMDLVMSLEREGFEPLGPATNLDAAMRLLADGTPEAAILDINLGSGATSAPIAAELEKRNVPFAFLTAYSRDMPIMDVFPGALFQVKPLTERTLRRVLDGLGVKARVSTRGS
jgi:DNA-binding response OmpR family regulator